MLSWFWRVTGSTTNQLAKTTALRCRCRTRREQTYGWHPWPMCTWLKEWAAEDLSNMIVEAARQWSVSFTWLSGDAFLVHKVAAASSKNGPRWLRAKTELCWSWWEIARTLTDLKDLSAHDEKRQTAPCGAFFFDGQCEALTLVQSAPRWGALDGTKGSPSLFARSVESGGAVASAVEYAVSSYTFVADVYGPRGSAPKPTRRDTDRPCASARKLTLAETSTDYE